MVIPKILHQTWKNKNIPNDFRRWSNSWKLLHTDFTYKFYTDHDCYKFIHINYPQYSDLYDSLSGIEKVDVFRYLILHKFGGIYVDMDCECIKPINNLVDEFCNCLITGIEYENPIQYLQWFIACPVKFPTMLELVDEIYRRSWLRFFMSFYLGKKKLVYWLTGPVLFTDVIKNTKYSVVVLDKGILGSYDKNKINGNSFLIHWFAGTWKSF